MAKRRRARKSNPYRTVGALVVNPRRKSVRRRKVKASRRRARKNPLLVRANKRRSKVRANSKRRVSKRRNTRRRARRNPLLVRTANPRKRRNSRRRSHARRNPLLIRANSRRRSSRRRANPHRRRHLARRRNSGSRSSGLAAMLKKIPLLGGVLSSMVGLVLPAALGAVSVEPTMLAAKFLGSYVPSMPSTLFYPGVGLLLAALIKGVGGRFMSAQLVDKLAVAAASAGGAVGYYKWRTGQESDMAGEMGLLEYAGYGDGFYSRVVPFR